LVLLAGKGHETYQIFADRTIEFDDVQVAKDALKELVPGA
jgi:UDP-N-acetylmuramoyl-L-alanyl-D-glutamate--2,6-diaminopimelate ligase